MPNTQKNELSIIEHLDELRYRLIICLVTVLVFSIFTYNFSNQIIEFLKKPYPDKLVFLNPVEPFNVVIKISLFGGFILALPVIFYEIWKFVTPGMALKERKYVFIFVPVAIILFCCGIAFSYLLFLPVSLKFLIGFGQGMFQPMISINNYFSFVMFLSLILGLIFEVPLVIMLLLKLKIIQYNTLAKSRKFMVVMAFFTAGIITPTSDIFNQCIIAVLLIILYETGLLAARIFFKNETIY